MSNSKKRYTKFILDMDFDPESKDVTVDVRGVDDSRDSVDDAKRVEEELRLNDAFERMIDRMSNRNQMSNRKGKAKKLRTFDQRSRVDEL
jgi:ribosome-binding ATPase YchF (GTP1/OBG family)